MTCSAAGRAGVHAATESAAAAVEDGVLLPARGYESYCEACCEVYCAAYCTTNGWLAVKRAVKSTVQPTVPPTVGWLDKKTCGRWINGWLYEWKVYG
eukprot:360982-Chlamydomonas_euryale.AAC.2